MSQKRETVFNRELLKIERLSRRTSRLKQPTPVGNARGSHLDEKNKPRTTILAPRQGESGVVSDEESDEHNVDTPGREGAGTHLSERINVNQTSSKKKVRTSD